MSHIMVGSSALNYHYGNQVRNPSKDIDFICTYDSFKELLKYYKTCDVVTSCYPLSGNKYVAKLGSGTVLEFEIAWGNGSSSDLILEFEDKTYASPEMQYLLKMSHRFRKNSPHFNKTMNDILFLRNKGVTIPEKYQDLLKLREKETYNYSHPSLNQSKKDFFSDDGINYKYDHDSIHLTVASLVNSGGEVTPAYNFMKPEENEVYCSKEMFEGLPENIKLLSVVEESMVLAIERSLVPFPYTKTPEEAFEYALMKVCTSITSGWWREYAWDNYYQALNLFYQTRESGWKYEKSFQLGVEDGTVKPFNKENY